MLKMNEWGPGGVWVFFLLLIIGGCTSSHSQRTTILHHIPANPPIPLLYASLEEGEVTVAGSGLPHARVNLLQNGTPLATGTISVEGTFDFDVPPLLADQAMSATQTMFGRTSQASQPVLVKRATLMHLTITSVLPPWIEEGQILTFTGKGVFSNGRITEPLSAMTWSSSHSNVATIQADGMVTTLAAGDTTIHATREGVTSDLVRLTVHPLPPVLFSTLRGGDTRVAGTAEPAAQIQLHKNGTPLGPPVQTDAHGQWEVHDLPMLTEADEVRSTQMVNAILSEASSPILVGPAVLTQIAIVPAPLLTIDRGTTHAFTATGTFSNGRVEEALAGVAWQSANPTVAKIEADGTVMALTAGATTIHAIREGVISDLVPFTVHPLPPVLLSTLKGGDTRVAGTAEPAAQIQLHNNGTPLGAPVQTNAHGQWEVQDLPMLTEADEVTSTQIVNAISSGTSAPVVVGRAGLTQITLATAPTTILGRGAAHRFTATGTFSNGQVKEALGDVIWQSEDPTVATIDNDGTATGINVGTTIVQAIREGVTSELATLTVQPLPPIVKPSLKAGDIIVTGRADPSAFIQLHKNGTPLGAPVQADAQGNWQAIDLQMLNEADRVTSTQTINNIQSSPSTIVQVLPNQPPTFESLSDQTIRFGNTLSVNLSATDLDSHALTYKILTNPLPLNSQWDPTTRLFTITPTAEQVGAIPLTFQVSDGVSVHEKTINIDVIPPKVVIILLSNEEGSVGMINVTSAGETMVLDQSGQAITMSSSKEVPPQPFLLKEDVIQDTFHRALEANPEKPLKFIVYFESGTVNISSESRQKFPEFRKTIASSLASRVAPNINVIGHTDRMATDEHNYDLSVRRARVIRDVLIADGIDSQLMEFTGHGEKNLLVHTPDEVSEPLNRRVEIYVR